MFLLKLEKIGVRDSQRRSEVAGIDRLQVLNSLVWTHSFAWWKAFNFPIEGFQSMEKMMEQYGITMPYAIHSAILPSAIYSHNDSAKDSWVTHQPPAKTSSRFVSERRWMAWLHSEIYEEIRGIFVAHLLSLCSRYALLKANTKDGVWTLNSPIFFITSKRSALKILRLKLGGNSGNWMDPLGQFHEFLHVSSLYLPMS